MTEHKLPLGWMQKRTPMRHTRRFRRWRTIYPGLHFEDTTWVVIEGPWRKLARHGSKSWVTVCCSEAHGGCGREYQRQLNNLTDGHSTRCVACSNQGRHKRTDGSGTS